MIGCAALLGLILATTAIDLSHNVPSRAAPIPWKIDEATAQRLAAEAEHGSATDLGDFDYDTSQKDPLFCLLRCNSTPAEGSFGYFAVNPWTGDVWALWGCHKLSTPALRKSQAEIRRRFTHEQLKQYTRLRRLKPDSIFEN